MESFIKSKKGAVILGIFTALLWGSAIPMIKMLYQLLEVPGDDTGAKILIAGMRFFIAGLLVLFVMKFVTKENVKKEDINFKFLIVIALVQTTIQYIFYYIGLSNTTGVKASIIQASNAFITVILSIFLISDEVLTKNKVIALVLGTLGILVVNLNKGADLSFNFTGEGYILIATVLNALATVLVRKYGRDQNSFVVSAGQFLIGSIPMIVLGRSLIEMEMNFTFASFGLLLYGSVISALAVSIWFLLLHHHGSSEIGIYKMLIPIFGSILSVIVLDEIFTPRLLLGMILVIGGTLVLNISKRKE